MLYNIKKCFIKLLIVSDVRNIIIKYFNFFISSVLTELTTQCTVWNNILFNVAKLYIHFQKQLLI